MSRVKKNKGFLLNTYPFICHFALSPSFIHYLCTNVISGTEIPTMFSLGNRNVIGSEYVLNGTCVLLNKSLARINKD